MIFDHFSHLIVVNVFLKRIYFSIIYFGILFFKFNVTATDAGFPALSDHAIIYVEFKGCPHCKVNLHSPRFFAPIYFVNVQEGNYSKNNLNLVQVFWFQSIWYYTNGFKVYQITNNKTIIPLIYLCL